MTFASVKFLMLYISVLFSCDFKKIDRYLFISIVSLVFYAFAGWQLVAILLISSASDFFLSGRFHTKNGKIYAYTAVSINLIFLTGVKIFNYYDGIINSEEPSLVPVGISFYSLQSIAYIIDVRRGKVKRIDRFIDYLAFISFFPQLVAGPIERCGKLFPQLERLKCTNLLQVSWALKLFSFGLLLKLVVSNRLSPIVNTVAASEKFDLIFLLNGVMGFVYVYADFFAYTLMARGVAAALNIDLSLNFNRPFKAGSLVGFWQRWHISLTRWMTDYFYIPVMRKIGGSPINKITFTAISMVFIGLWHGFGLNFIVFGLIHGFLMQAFPLLDKLLETFKFAPKFSGRFGLFLTMAISGNIFLFGSVDQLSAVLHAESYMFLDQQNILAYVDSSLLFALSGIIFLSFHEFSKGDILYENKSVINNLTCVVVFLIVTIMFFKEGGDHVYFAF